MISEALFIGRCDGYDKRKNDQCRASHAFSLSVRELGADGVPIRTNLLFRFHTEQPGWLVRADEIIFCPQCKITNQQSIIKP